VLIKLLLIDIATTCTLLSCRRVSSHLSRIDPESLSRKFLTARATGHYRIFHSIQLGFRLACANYSPYQLKELFMKRLVIASLFATALLGAHAETYTDYARVQNAEPQYENINVPRNECSSHWVEERDSRVSSERPDRQYGGAIVGGLAGGVLGHQVGGGSGKDAATALGVVLGAIAGDHLSNRDQGTPYDNGRYETTQREVQRCRTVYDTQTRITGYRVAYEYRGQHYTTFMHTNPGNSLPVRVTIDPIQQ
jgi:uncharacterized protein YcfJ